jgi:18S rRNA (guanine1575-N7)-methyltransferase
MSRPEGTRAPELFYDQNEARKYNQSSRMINIQAEISERAIEMLGLPEGKPCFILDVGCGSGLSGEALEEAGHYWVVREFVLIFYFSVSYLDSAPFI